MAEANNLDTNFCFLICITAFLLIISILIGLTSVLSDFSQELRYLNIEIRRTEGCEQKYWIRKRRRLWLSLILFVKY